MESKGYPRWVRNRTTNRTILGAFVAFVVVEGLLGGVLIPRFRAMAGGRQIPDVMLAYDYAEIYTAIDGYGATAIQFYRYIEAVDMVFPLVYGAFLTLLVSRVLTTMDVWEQLEPAVFLPLVALVFDYLENAGIFLMLHQHPGEYAFIAGLTNVMTILKYATIGCSMVVILAGAAVLSYRRIRCMRRGQPA